MSERPSIARQIVARVCNYYRNSDLRADSKAILASFDEEISGLQAEITRLQRELDLERTESRRWKDSSNANRDAAMGYQDRALKAERELEEARRDTVRLDWLDQGINNGSLQSSLIVGGPWRYVSPQRPAVGYWKFESLPKLGRHETARAAIDAAIAQAGEERKE